MRRNRRRVALADERGFDVALILEALAAVDQAIGLARGVWVDG